MNTKYTHYVAMCELSFPMDGIFIFFDWQVEFTKMPPFTKFQVSHYYEFPELDDNMLRVIFNGKVELCLEKTLNELVEQGKVIKFNFN